MIHIRTLDELLVFLSHNVWPVSYGILIKRKRELDRTRR